jgi:hypothetical protein
MGCRNDKSVILKGPIGTDGFVLPGVGNTCEHDLSCYSVVHDLDKLPDLSKSKYVLIRHSLSQVQSHYRWERLVCLVMCAV